MARGTSTEPPEAAPQNSPVWRAGAQPLMLIGKAPGDPKPVVTRAGDRVVRRSLDFHEAVGRRLAAAPPVATARR